MTTTLRARNEAIDRATSDAYELTELRERVESLERLAAMSAEFNDATNKVLASIADSHAIVSNQILDRMEVLAAFVARVAKCDGPDLNIFNPDDMPTTRARLATSDVPALRVFNGE